MTTPTGILVVDDHDGVRAVLGIALRMAGFAVWEVAGGEEAALVLRAHLDDIDLALVDLHLPRMNGLATVEALKRLKPQMRYCLMTGTLQDEGVLLSAGADAVMTKPFSPLEVARRVRELTGAS